MIKDEKITPVAQNVISKCTKCKMDLNHVVVSHSSEGIVERVKCLTCGGEHKYRPVKKSAPKKTVKAAKKGTRNKKADYAKDFEGLAEKFKDKEPLHYSMAGLFKKDDVIDHTTFGMGIVISVSYQRMEVAFPEGPRVLVCNR
jgi:hypothetical protein